MDDEVQDPGMTRMRWVMIILITLLTVGSSLYLLQNVGLDFSGPPGQQTPATSATQPA